MKMKIVYIIELHILTVRLANSEGLITHFSKIKGDEVL